MFVFVVIVVVINNTKIRQFFKFTKKKWSNLTTLNYAAGLGVDKSQRCISKSTLEGITVID